MFPLANPAWVYPKSSLLTVFQDAVSLLDIFFGIAGPTPALQHKNFFASHPTPVPHVALRLSR